MKKLLAMCVCFSVLFVGCATTDVARSPKSSEIFVTSGDIDEPYTPVGFIVARRTEFKLLIFTIFPAKLQDVLDEQLIKKAKELGADGIVNVKYNSITHPFPMSLFKGAMAEVSGLAIKRK